MKTIFYLISILGSLYFITKKRNFDLYTFAFFSSIIYFVPGFFGHVVYPNKVNVPLDPGVYKVFNLVLISIFLVALYKDVKDRRLKNKANNRTNIIEGKYILDILVILSIIIMVYEIVTVNKYLLKSKKVMMPKLGSIFLLLKYSSSLAFVISFIEKKKIHFILSSIPLLFMFIIGFRSPITLAVFAIIILTLKESGRIILIFYNFIYSVCILLFGYLMLMGKRFYGTLKSKGIVEAIAVLFNKEIAMGTFFHMEPFSIQTILNEIIVKEFYIGFDHLKDISYQLLIVPSLFGADTQAFNTIIQTELFPGLDYGMAYNIWAEALASGGLNFLMIVIIIYIFILSILDKLMESTNNIIKGTSGLIGAYWGFYIHRSSIAVQLTYTRHILYVIFISFFISMLMTLIFNPKARMKI